MPQRQDARPRGFRIALRALEDPESAQVERLRAVVAPERLLETRERVEDLRGQRVARTRGELQRLERALGDGARLGEAALRTQILGARVRAGDRGRGRGDARAVLLRSRRGLSCGFALDFIGDPDPTRDGDTSRELRTGPLSEATRRRGPAMLSTRRPRDGGSRCG